MNFKKKQNTLWVARRVNRVITVRDKSEEGFIVKGQRNTEF